MYIYEGHMGSLYVSDYILDYDDLYCEECGDSDWFLRSLVNVAEDSPARFLNVALLISLSASMTHNFL